MYAIKPVIPRCIHCGKKIDEENDQITIKSTYSVPLTAMGDTRLVGDSYREINVIHCHSCDAIELEMVNFRNKLVVYHPLQVSIIWGAFFILGWLLSNIFDLQDFFLAFSAIFTVVLVIYPFLSQRLAIREFLTREEVERLYRLALKNDYAKLLPSYLVLSSILAIFFPIGIPVLLTAGIYYRIQFKKGKIEKECFFRRLPQQCKYCSGGTSFRRFHGVMVHYYRHSDNCAIFLRGWET
ncbi:MAG: hypothetical protein ACFFD4_20790 [Candidatus Odinarchaeota archaeon]